ncbi:MAG TPA: hypothetical protein VII60_05660 [Acidimicrobiales bacterium]
MSAPLRSSGWSVRPSFVANGSTAQVTLLSDDTGLTQLAGEPSVAWQTPWAELGNLQLLRFARGIALFATANGVRYCWRNRDVRDYEAWRVIVLEHGGTVARHRRRAGVFALALVVMLAALAGGFGSWLYSNTSGTKELADAKGINLTQKDFPSGWFVTTSSLLDDLFPAYGQVDTSTTTPVKPLPASSEFAQAAALFQRCVGVSNARDRVFGLSGQQPDYQVSSRVFSSPSFGGIQIASTSQYYKTTTMVDHDVAEMSRTKFGSCFVSSNVALVKAVLRVKIPTSNVGTTFRPRTFVKGWVRGGEAPLTLPNTTGTLHLVVVVISSGHYEVTLGAIVDQWPKSKTFIASLASTLLSRTASSSSAAD